MTRSSSRGAAVAAALILSFGAVAAAPVQTAGSPSQDPEPTTLTVGEQTAPPGAPVVVSLTLSVPDAVKAGSIDVRVTYPKAVLTFAKVEPSGLALGVFATIETSIVKGPDAASSTLLATIATPADPDARKAFASGLLAYVGFTIAKTAKPGTTVPLKVASVVRTAESEPHPVLPVRSVNGKVIVANPPVISCFFYMH
jgi:hypothetical protein